MAGQVTGELSGSPIFLENAATEATLEALLQATLANSPNKGKAAAIQKAYEEAVKKSTERQQGNTDALKRKDELLAKEEKQRQDLNKQMQEEKEAREKLFNGLNELGQLVGKGLGAAFGTATPKVNDFTNALSGIPILGPIIGALGNALQGSIDNFRTLSTVGADFGTSVLGVRKVAERAGLSLETFTKTVTDNSSMLALLGGNAAAGAKIFQSVSASLQGPFQQGLANLGFTMEETAEYTAGYLAIQTRLGRAQRMTQDELNAGTQDYLLELDRLARVTGLRREELQKEIMSQTMDKRMKALAMQLGTFGTELMGTIGSIEAKNKDTAEGLKDIMLTNGAPITQQGKSIMLNNRALAEAAVAYKNQKIDIHQFNAALRAGGKASADAQRANGGFMAGISHLNNGINDTFMAMSIFENHGLKAAEAADEQAYRLRVSGDALLNLDKSLLIIRDNFQAILLPSLQLFGDFLVNNVEFLEEFAVGLRKGLETFLDTFKKDGIGAAIGQSLSGLGQIVGPILADILGETFRSLFTSNPVITGTIVAITALFASAKVIGAVKTIADTFGEGGGKGKGKVGPRPGSLGGWQNSGNMSGGPSSPVGGPAGGNLIKGGKLFGVGALASYGGGMAADSLKEAGHTKSGAWMDMASTTAGMAGTGALLGSMFGPLGTLIGGGAGAAVGAGMGIYQNWGNFFGGGDKKTAEPDKKDIDKAAQVAQTVTSEEVKALSAALKDLDYSKLTIKPEVFASLDSGTMKMRQLRGEVNAMTTSFRALDNTGLDKITKGISSLSEEFEKFNKRFSIDFMEVFKKLDKESQATLLSQLNDKMDQLNSNALRLIEVQEEVEGHTKSMAGKTGNNMAKR
jgi:hypothetical protein